MSKRGRPRKDTRDFPFLFWMAQVWDRQGCKGSIRALAKRFAAARYCAEPHREHEFSIQRYLPREEYWAEQQISHGHLGAVSKSYFEKSLEEDQLSDSPQTKYARYRIRENVRTSQDRHIESTLKRLTTKFSEYLKEGVIFRINVFLKLDYERECALKELGSHNAGPFSIYEANDHLFAAANIVAIDALANKLSVSYNEAEILADEGLEVLREWFPGEFGDWRI